MEGFCLDFWAFFEVFELEMFHGEHWVGLFFRDCVEVRQGPGPPFMLPFFFIGLACVVL